MTRSSTQRTTSARGLWSSLLDDGKEPTAGELTGVLAHLQSPELRDRLVADMPGLDLPMELLLFGESGTAPDWNRMDTAKVYFCNYAATRIEEPPSACPHLVENLSTHWA